MGKLTGQFVVVSAEQVEEAYRQTAKQFGLLAPNERIVMWPKRQAIVFVPDARSQNTPDTQTDDGR